MCEYKHVCEWFVCLQKAHRFVRISEHKAKGKARHGILSKTYNHTNNNNNTVPSSPSFPIDIYAWKMLIYIHIHTPYMWDNLWNKSQVRMCVVLCALFVMPSTSFEWTHSDSISLVAGPMENSFSGSSSSTLIGMICGVHTKHNTHMPIAISKWCKKQR